MLTDAQQQCTNHLDGPLFVSAGAGSGKTFTLQARVCQAFLPESGPYLQSLTQLLAITFTNAAARELQERIARALRKQGLSKQALEIDSAYISTIHSLCLRILHDNAFVFGVNPALSIVSDQEYAAIKEEAFGMLAQLAKSSECTAYEELQERLCEQGQDALQLECTHLAPLFEYCPYRELKKLTEELLSALYNTKGSFDALVVARRSSFMEALFAFKDCADMCAGEAEEYVKQKKPSATALKNSAVAQENAVLLAEIMSACEGLHGAYLSEGEQGEKSCNAFNIRDEDEPRGQGSLESSSYDALLDLVQTLLDDIRFYNARSASKAGKIAYAQLRQLHAWLRQSLELEKNLDLQDLCIDAARKLDYIIDALLGSRGKITNDKLISATLDKLQEHGHIARKYQEQFKLALIDEFQDTDEMQFALISLLVRPEHICTVGDAQQSIYKFRGADVSLFERVAKRIDNHPQGLCESLDINFRSHSDILSFVRRVCAQESVFGAHFLDLQAGRDETLIIDKAPQGGRIVLAACMKPKRKSKAGALEERVDEDVVREASESSTHKAAAFIAHEFSRLRSEGKSARDMAVLLGALTHIDVYTQALRKAGFDCVLVGGKSFYAQPEVQGVCGLLRFLVNGQDSRALFSFASAHLLKLEDAELIELMDYTQGRISLDACSEFVSACIERIDAARDMLRKEGVSQSLQELLERLGIVLSFEDLGVEGMAKKANVLKLLRIIANMEAEHPLWSAARIAKELDWAILSKLGEPQGSLNISGQEAVRIMSIHKSKGLEFDYVALAEFEESQTNIAAQWTRTRNESDETRLFVSLNPLKSKRRKSKDREASKPSLDACFEPPCVLDSFEMKRFVKDQEVLQEAAERRRLLYVGMTRAREYLLVCGNAHYPSKKELETMAQEQVDLFDLPATCEDDLSACSPDIIICDPLFDEIRSALVQGDTPFNTLAQDFDFGGLAPARYVCIDESSVAEGAEVQDVQVSCPENKQDAACVHILPCKEGVEVHALTVQEKTRPFASYTSLAHREAWQAHVRNYKRASMNDKGRAPRNSSKSNERRDCLKRLAQSYDASLLGEAFHKLMELRLQDIPLDEALDRLRCSYYIDKGCLERLGELASLAESTKFLDSVKREGKYATEMPFVCSKPSNPQSFMEGTFDLFVAEPTQEMLNLLNCINNTEGSSYVVGREDTKRIPEVCVVDYKLTMGNQDSYEVLYEKYLLQASFYALALLQLGFTCIALQFMVIDFTCPNNENCLQWVQYNFTKDDILKLTKFVDALEE